MADITYLVSALSIFIPNVVEYREEQRGKAELFVASSCSYYPIVLLGEFKTSFVYKPENFVLYCALRAINFQANNNTSLVFKLVVMFQTIFKFHNPE